MTSYCITHCSSQHISQSYFIFYEIVLSAGSSASALLSAWPTPEAGSQLRATHAVENPRLILDWLRIEIMRAACQLGAAYIKACTYYCGRFNCYPGSGSPLLWYIQFIYVETSTSLKLLDTISFKSLKCFFSTGLYYHPHLSSSASSDDSSRYQFLDLFGDIWVLHVILKRSRVSLCLLENTLHDRVL